MSAITIDTKAQAEELIIGTGVRLSDGRVARAEGEGRGRRYFLGDDNTAKGDVIDAVLGDEGAEPVSEGGDDDLETIMCEYCGREVGYLTGSHMDSHDGGPQTVAEYRAFVADRDGVEADEVPLAPEATAAKFATGGHANSEETREKIGAKIKARWEAGEYDHLRSADGEAEEA